MTSRFASFTGQVIEKIVADKDTQNTKKSTKVAKALFADYVKEKNLSEPEEKKELTQTLKTYILCRSEKERIRSMYRPSASADNPYLDLDYSGYHKNLIQ